MPLKWDKELTLDTIKELADTTVGDLYLSAYSATLNGKRSEKLCVEAYTRLYMNRDHIASMEESFTPLEAAKYFLLTLLSKNERERVNNELFSLSRDRLEDQSILDSIVTRALNKIELDLPRYAPTYSGTRGSVYVLALMLCVIAVILFVWLNPFAADNTAYTDTDTLTVSVEPVELPDPDLLALVDISPAPVDTCVKAYTVACSGPDAQDIAAVVCFSPDGSTVPVYNCNDEYHAFLAPENGIYELTFSCASGKMLKRYVTVSGIEDADRPLSKLSYAIVHDSPVELELFTANGVTQEYRITADPKHASIEESDGVFTLTPERGFVGIDSFAVEVVYEDGSTHEISIPVVVYNNAPYYKQELLTSSVRHTPGKNGLVMGRLEASDMDGDAITYKLTDYSGCIPVLTASGRYALQVLSECVSGKDEAWFSFTVSDGVLTSDEYTMKLSLTNGTVSFTELSQTVYCYTGEGGFYTLNLPATDDDGDALEWTILSELTDNKTADGHEIMYSSDRSAISVKLNPSLTTAAVHTITLSCTDGWATSENISFTLNILPNPGPIAGTGNVTTIEMGQTDAVGEVSLKETSPFYSYRIIAVSSEDGSYVSSAGWDDLMFDFVINPGLITAHVTVTVQDTLTGQTAEIPYTINVE